MSPYRLPLLAVLLAAPLAAQAPKPQSSINTTIIHAQVILDHLGFSPGVIDGREGQSLKLALSGFQTARGLPVTGKLDQPTLRALAAHRAIRPVRLAHITPEDARGPFIGQIPKEYPDQAKLPTLGYRNLLEKLSEKYHTSPRALIALNGPSTLIGAGRIIKVPNVTPTNMNHPADLDGAWRATLAALNVGAGQPQGKRVVVDKSESALKVYDGQDRLIAQFPATMGSEHDPLPIGSWTIKGAAYNPPFHYNPDLFWDADSDDEKAKLPPGPNGPVGVVWLDLSKPHYGIHGTPTPETIGRTESHGCIRLTNWDAARLAMMVKPGTPARFQA